MADGAWNEYTAEALSEHVGAVVQQMILDRDAKIRALQNRIIELEVLNDELEKDIDISDARAAA